MADNNNITEYVRRKLFAMIHTHTHVTFYWCAIMARNLIGTNIITTCPCTNLLWQS